MRVVQFRHSLAVSPRDNLSRARQANAATPPSRRNLPCLQLSWTPLQRNITCMSRGGGSKGRWICVARGQEQRQVQNSSITPPRHLHMQMFQVGIYRREQGNRQSVSGADASWFPQSVSAEAEGAKIQCRMTEPPRSPGCIHCVVNISHPRQIHFFKVIFRS